MEAPTRARSTRDRPAKAPLSESAIVEAALAITQAEGLAAVTMRRVAAELDTGAASLYVYVRNREELLRAMIDRVAGTIPKVVPDPSRWRDQVHGVLDGLRLALEHYPGLAMALPGEPLTGDNSLAALDNLLGIMRAGNISNQDAAWACDTLFLIVTATANEDDLRRAAGLVTEADFSDTLTKLRATFDGLPPERYPNVTAMGAELVSGDTVGRFRFAVDTFLDGLVARSA